MPIWRQYYPSLFRSARRWMRRGGRFREAECVRDRLAELVGYVIDVKTGGEETVNCHSTFDEDYDTHIEIALSTKATKTRRVVIEVTPRVRAKAASAGDDWSTDALRTAILHKWVRVRGWMFYDWRHENQSENTHPGGDTNWRATAWEIHPVTSIRVVPKPTP